MKAFKFTHWDKVMLLGLLLAANGMMNADSFSIYIGGFIFLVGLGLRRRYQRKLQ